jgi:prolipoprotein diacylglyceryltransferase
VNVILSGYFRRLLSIVFLHDLSANFFLNIFALPLEILIIGAILKISPLKLSDLVAPGMSFALICYKIACFCDGCCYGVATEKYGLMNQWTNRKDFPIQLVECGCAIIMFVILVILFRKKERKDGTLYPIFMLMYCASRFVSEFWRDDYPNVLGLLKSYHIQCIIGFVEGAILLFVALKWGEKISDYYATKKQELLERFRSKSSNKNDTQE